MVRYNSIYILRNHQIRGQSLIDRHYGVSKLADSSSISFTRFLVYPNMDWSDPGLDCGCFQFSGLPDRIEHRQLRQYAGWPNAEYLEHFFITGHWSNIYLCRCIIWIFCYYWLRGTSVIKSYNACRVDYSVELMSIGIPYLIPGAHGRSLPWRLCENRWAP